MTQWPVHSRDKVTIVTDPHGAVPSTWLQADPDGASTLYLAPDRSVPYTWLQADPVGASTLYCNELWSTYDAFEQELSLAKWVSIGCCCWASTTVFPLATKDHVIPTRPSILLQHWHTWRPWMWSVRKKWTLAEYWAHLQTILRTSGLEVMPKKNFKCRASFSSLLWRMSAQGTKTNNQ